jgi:hypothetical protein
MFFFMYKKTQHDFLAFETLGLYTKTFFSFFQIFLYFGSFDENRVF